MAGVDGVEILHDVDGNEVFANIPARTAESMRAGGVQFYQWPDGSARLVTSWCTQDAEISSALDAAR